MGYTTTFTGRIALYRPEGPVMAEFLRAIHEGDKDAVGIFADWLADQGDPRADAARAGGEALWRPFGLRPEHAAYLHQFSDTRRVRRDPERAALLPDPFREAACLPVGREGGYFVGGAGFKGQDDDDSVLDGNKPPKGQPGLWCGWEPDKGWTAIIWNGREKFYDHTEWLAYLIAHFLGPWGYVLNGRLDWQGERDDDMGTITVTENAVEAKRRWS